MPKSKLQRELTDKNLASIKGEVRSQLLDQIKSAFDLYSQNSESQRAGLAIYLRIAKSLMTKVLDENQTYLLKPLNDLLLGLSYLEAGVTTKVLAPISSDSKIPARRQMLEALAVYLADQLRENGYSAMEANEKLARTADKYMNNMGRGEKGISARSIRHWRQMISNDIKHLEPRTKFFYVFRKSGATVSPPISDARLKTLFRLMIKTSN